MAKREEALGLAELAAETGLDRANLCTMRKRGTAKGGKVPEPDWQLACGPVWLRSTVQGWIDERRAR